MAAPWVAIGWITPVSQLKHVGMISNTTVPFSEASVAVAEVLWDAKVQNLVAEVFKANTGGLVQFQ